jgi:hypothetical protein
MFRRFGKLHARMLLYKENELTELEKKLDKLDSEIGGSDEIQWQHTCRPIEEDESKLYYLMKEIQDKLVEYDDLLLKDFALRDLPQPRRCNHQSLFDYIYNYKPLAKGAYDNIFHVEDFVTPKNSPVDTCFDDYIRSALQLPPFSALRVSLLSRLEVLGLGVETRW